MQGQWIKYSLTKSNFNLKFLKNKIEYKKGKSEEMDVWICQDKRK